MSAPSHAHPACQTSTAIKAKQQHKARLKGIWSVLQHSCMQNALNPAMPSAPASAYSQALFCLGQSTTAGTARVHHLLLCCPTKKNLGRHPTHTTAACCTPAAVFPRAASPPLAHCGNEPPVSCVTAYRNTHRDTVGVLPACCCWPQPTVNHFGPRLPDTVGSGGRLG